MVSTITASGMRVISFEAGGGKCGPQGNLVAMSLDGLRAWIGIVERKLAMRTRVFLVLAAIAVGGAGAAIYLAVEANDDSVGKSDLQQVRDELAGTIAPSEGGSTSQLEAEV